MAGDDWFIPKAALLNFLERQQNDYAEPLAVTYLASDEAVRLTSFARKWGGSIGNRATLLSQVKIQSRIQSFELEVLGAFKRGEHRVPVLLEDEVSGLASYFVPISVDNVFLGLLSRPLLVPRSAVAKVSARLADLMGGPAEHWANRLQSESREPNSLEGIFRVLDTILSELKKLLYPGVRHKRQHDIATERERFSRSALENLRKCFLEAKGFNLRETFGSAIATYRTAGDFDFVALLEDGALAGRAPAVTGASLPDDEPSAYSALRILKDVIELPVTDDTILCLLEDGEKLPLQGAIKDLFGLEAIRRLWVTRLTPLGGASFLLAVGSSLDDGWKLNPLHSTQAFVESMASTILHQLYVYEALRRLQDTIPNTVHSIRIPMQRVMSLTELALLEARKPGPGALDSVIQRLEGVRNATIYQRAQTKGYMLFSTGQGVKADEVFRKRPARLGPILKGVIDLFSVPDLSEGVSIAVEDFPHFANTTLTPLDKVYIEVMFMNLLDNAVKYSFQRREVRIALTSETRGGVRYWRTSISNFGLAISSLEKEAIFEPYYRGRVIGDPRFFKPGTGIGLAVAQRIAKAHGGWIEPSSSSWRFERYTGQKPEELDGSEQIGVNVTFDTFLEV